MVEATRRATVFVLGAAVVLSTLPAYAADKSVGRVITLRGRAVVKHAHGSGGSVEEPLVRGAHLHQGDVVRTRAGSAVRLLMRDKSLLDVGPLSSMQLANYEVKPAVRKVRVRLWLGRLWSRVTRVFGDKKNFEVQTGNAVCGVRGTEFVVDVESNGDTSVTVLEGAVDVSSLEGDVNAMVEAMQQRRVDGNGISDAAPITPDQAQQMRQSTGPGANMPSDGAQGRVNETANANRPEGAPPQGQGGPPAGAGPGGGDDQGAPPAEHDGADDPFDDVPGADTEPPVDFEPDAGRTRVRGKIEVRP